LVWAKRFGTILDHGQDSWNWPNVPLF
jgi:hypothetical protein